jgi:SAM-dependent methyltransferase
MTRSPTAGAWDELDRAYARFLDEHPLPPGGSLLAQTILTGAARRSLLPLLDVARGADVLDLGTGYGPVLLELARVRAVRGLGVDTDAEVLAAAEAITRSLASWLHDGSSIRFRLGEAGSLDLGDATFDLVCARLLFQHLEDPRAVVRECHRILRPGGRAVVFDVDDGFSVTYPATSPELDRLEGAFDRAQSLRGGDREVGRKLTTYFVDAGFAIASVQLLAQAQHVAAAQGDASRAVNLARLQAARGDIVGAGLIEAGEFDRCLAAYAVEPAVARFRAESQVVVVAVRT